MKGLYERSELSFALVWIVTYCVLQSLANPLNKTIGIEYSASAVFCILQSIVMVGFLKRNGLFKRYGLCRSVVPATKFLYYIPLFILATGNLWNGAVLKHSPADTACRYRHQGPASPPASAGGEQGGTPRPLPGGPGGGGCPPLPAAPGKAAGEASGTLRSCTNRRGHVS